MGACAFEPQNAEACKPALEQLSDLGVSVPADAKALALACDTPAGVAALQSGADVRQAIVARASRGQTTHNASVLEMVLTKKVADERCTHSPEGQICVSKNQLIYCSAHKRLSAGTTNCETHSGHLSLCAKGGGLRHGYCDDPFCRSGGAYAGSGEYCHGNSVVSCKGSDPPRTVETCSDKHIPNPNGGPDTILYNTCLGSHNFARCRY